MKKTDSKELEEFMSYLRLNFTLETFIKFLDLNRKKKDSLIDDILLSCSKSENDYKKLLKKKDWIPWDDDLMTWVSDNFKEEKSFSSFINKEWPIFNSLTVYSSKINNKFYVISNEYYQGSKSCFNCLKNFKNKSVAINFAKNEMKKIKKLI